MKRHPEFLPLPLLMPEESDERAVLASIYAAVRPLGQPRSTGLARRRSARGVEAMALRLRDNARRHLKMLQE